MTEYIPWYETYAQDNTVTTALNDLIDHFTTSNAQPEFTMATAHGNGAWGRWDGIPLQTIEMPARPTYEFRNGLGIWKEGSISFELANDIFEGEKPGAAEEEPDLQVDDKLLSEFLGSFERHPSEECGA